MEVKVGIKAGYTLHGTGSTSGLLSTARMILVEIDPEDRSKSIERLVEQGGLSNDDAGSLVDAAVAGAVDHAFELINGSGAVPTAMTTARADQLRFVCLRAGRLVTQREVEILFRVTSATAKSTISTMLATYQDGLRDEFLARMRADATVLKSGTEEEGLTWTLRFSESSTLEMAWSEIQRLRFTGAAEANPSRRTIIVPRTIGETDVLKELGIEEPSE